MTTEEQPKRRPEPKPLLDGTCFVCGKEVPVIARLAADAFCSTVCCRAYFETTDIITTSTAKKP